ncbi:tetratricopeptide repeat protein [Asticcacaulis sp. BYS171W]|uniref:Tetratricopeptide repeat protein n=1 Tax=Asticcacaulis aquaticus TaxID=2984212 RepID=A0ABT5HR52_9CAUL|nr:tetratricopeptide repeat protein [Asticcacaulis aquaticus]MDC7682464.1 tetratricopeptide repeat protein [Asticcacaulis aquaticus]
MRHIWVALGGLALFLCGPVGVSHAAEVKPATRPAAIDWSKKSFDEIQQGAFNGDAEAQYQLGLRYMYQAEIQDYFTALRWFQSAADQGHGLATYSAAIMYALGQGTPVDFARAMALYKLAAERGIVRAYSDIGIAYREGEAVAKDPAEAVKWFRKGAEARDPQSVMLLGRSYIDGMGVEKDVARGLALMEEAAALGDVRAQQSLAAYYYLGTLVTTDYAKAFRWAEAAANGGSLWGHYYAGMMHELGRGTTVDYIAALQHYSIAVKQKHAQSLVRMAGMACRGQGLKPDVPGCTKILSGLAGQGMPDAFFMMGELYETGGGVAKDLPRAYVWKHFGIILRDGTSSEWPDELKYLSDGFTPEARARLPGLRIEVAKAVGIRIEGATTGKISWNDLRHPAAPSGASFSVGTDWKSENAPLHTAYQPG